MPVDLQIVLASDLSLGFLLNFLKDLEMELDSEIRKDLFLGGSRLQFLIKKFNL